MNFENRYDSLFQFYADCHGLDWMDLKAQAMAESRLNPMAISPVGAKGLMQFMPATFDEIAAKEMLKYPSEFDPEHSIRCGARYMAELRARYHGDQQRALAAYNWGLGRVDHAQPEDYPDETKNYLARIKLYRSGLV